MLAPLLHCRLHGDSELADEWRYLLTEVLDPKVGAGWALQDSMRRRVHPLEAQGPCVLDSRWRALSLRAEHGITPQLTIRTGDHAVGSAQSLQC